MKINKYEIIPIETGKFALDGGAMFGVVPKNLWERSNPADKQNRIELALRCLLLKGKDKNILIDTGIGEKLNEKLEKIYKVDHSKFTLQESLKKAGVEPEEITDVILTHLHFDHTGGTAKKINGKLELNFPNAMHHVQLEQWEWANGPAEKDRASFIKNNFLLMEQKEKLNILNSPGKLFDGIETFVMYGHTPGMQLIKISDSSNTILYCADLIPTMSHIPVPWVMAYDNNPLITIEEKKRILPKVDDENWILFFEHDPYLAAGTVQLTDKGYSLKKEINLVN